MKRGFTLAEVMIALIVVVAVMAASAPILTKKTQEDLSKKQGQPWEWIGNTANAKFNASGEGVAVLLGMNPNIISQGEMPRMAIKTVSNNTDHIQFNQEGTRIGALAINSRGCFLGNYPKIDTMNFHNNHNLGTTTNAIAIGNVGGYTKNSVAVGTNAIAGVDSVALGTNAVGFANTSIAIGAGANTYANATYYPDEYKWKIDYGETYDKTVDAVAIGHNAKAHSGSVAIGTDANTARVRKSSTPNTSNTLALGYNANVDAVSCFVIGKNSKTTGWAENSSGDQLINSILIAHSTTVSRYFTCNYNGSNNPPSIRLANKVIIGSPSYSSIVSGNGYVTNALYAKDVKAESHVSFIDHQSDLRLKNIKSEYTSGMDKLNKLKIYNYTFKFAPSKKRVGIMAQDLLKIFPDAVSKDENGYYTMRREDIFYAMVNALKDFDKKIKNIITSVSNINKDFTDMELKVCELSKQTEINAHEIKLLKQRVKSLEQKVDLQKNKKCEVKR